MGPATRPTHPSHTFADVSFRLCHLHDLVLVHVELPRHTADVCAVADGDYVKATTQHLSINTSKQNRAAQLAAEVQTAVRCCDACSISV